MVLEATMIVIDNSEFTRNGDYLTNRFEAQLDAVDLIFQAKTNSNPENTVGLLAAAGNGPQVLSTLTADFGKLLSGIHETKIEGSLHFATGIQVAALALKHRQNKVQHQRIVAFVGSPIQESEKELEKLAKKMKKNNIAIDFINYGEESINTSKLEKFVSIVNSHDNSHLVTVPPSDRLLYEVVGSSPIVIGEDGGNFNAGGETGGDGFDFGSDPNMDPDLALALRLSLEEEQARQAREQQTRTETQAPLESINESTREEPSNSNDNENNNDGDTNMEDAPK
ncbi:hypothetical protein WICANDRAFT_86392 [Wickerhamomyces anomalus NRRL Y-366-8]|uniref:VWFA domain-containing protein n=1 Tax=Wickerhamomyces anomalus (strain ATCC 58044 / CBS 1984 / NCYC 433 / NRRL Y-366-8) TaxID=683960 RepID=A0A1E3P814_WICAA|nr:uncharacterized protein WICANDRAFT_86392 [Wickerhamomyces anomalus NRRL Y-366-8]ODQ61551.1 hypothetical protein WICANDRAFT_86392 [Wickerhamomyces anomalus NRRL Y-366-8]